VGKQKDKTGGAKKAQGGLCYIGERRWGAVGEAGTQDKTARSLPLARGRRSGSAAELVQRGQKQCAVRPWEGGGVGFEAAPGLAGLGGCNAGADRALGAFQQCLCLCQCQWPCPRPQWLNDSSPASAQVSVLREVACPGGGQARDKKSGERARGMIQPVPSSFECGTAYSMQGKALPATRRRQPHALHPSVNDAQQSDGPPCCLFLTGCRR
jgi:hypothetical protein